MSAGSLQKPGFPAARSNLPPPLLEGGGSAPHFSVPRAPEQLARSDYLLNNDNKEDLPMLCGLFLNTRDIQGPLSPVTCQRLVEINRGESRLSQRPGQGAR